LRNWSEIWICRLSPFCNFANLQNLQKQENTPTGAPTRLDGGETVASKEKAAAHAK